MVLIGKEIELVWDNCLNIAAFAGIGSLSGRTVNWFSKWTSAPSFFKKTTQVDLQSAVVCCALFKTIDCVFYYNLRYLSRQLFGEDVVDKPIYSALRLGTSAFWAIGLVHRFASHIKLASVETKTGLAVISTAMVIYNVIYWNLKEFNSHYQSVSSK
jgi:hypothetical protein